MNKIYYLSSCDTCKRILKEIAPLENITLQDIKKDTITTKQLEEMYSFSKSYEALFSKRAKMYKEMGLAEKNLSEEEYKNLILEHYTFLKRPVMFINDEIFIGNSKKVVAAAKASLHS